MDFLKKSRKKKQQSSSPTSSPATASSTQPRLASPHYGHCNDSHAHPALPRHPACRGQSCSVTWRIFRNLIVYYFPKFSKGARHFFVSVFIFTNIVSHGTSLHNVFHLDKFDPVTQNSSQIDPNCILLQRHLSHLFAKFVLSPPGWTLSTAVCLTAIDDDLAVHESSRHSRGFSFSAFPSGFSSTFWYLLFPLLFRCVV